MTTPSDQIAESMLDAMAANGGELPSYLCDIFDPQERRIAEVAQIERLRASLPEVCPGCGCNGGWFLNSITEQFECSCIHPEYGYGCGYQWRGEA